MCGMSTLAFTPTLLGVVIVCTGGIIVGPPYLVYKGTKLVLKKSFETSVNGAVTTQLKLQHCKDRFDAHCWKKAQNRFQQLIDEKDADAIRLQDILVNLCYFMFDGGKLQWDLTTLMSRVSLGTDLDILLDTVCLLTWRYATIKKGKRSSFKRNTYKQDRQLPPKLPLESLSNVVMSFDELPAELAENVRSFMTPGTQKNVGLAYVRDGHLIATDAAGLAETFQTAIDTL